MRLDPTPAPTPSSPPRASDEQVSRLVVVMSRLAAAAGFDPVREPLTESVRSWSVVTASLAEALLHDDTEGLASQRAAIMVAFGDEDDEQLIQVLCLQPEACERNVVARWKWAMLEDYTADERFEAFLDAAGSSAADIIDGIAAAASGPQPGRVRAEVARAAVLHLLHDTLWLLDDEDDGNATIGEIAQLDPQGFDRLTLALWPLRVTQSERNGLTLAEMEYIGRLNDRSPDLALRAAEFFRDRGGIDADALNEYLGNGTMLADGVL